MKTIITFTSHAITSRIKQRQEGNSNIVVLFNNGSKRGNAGGNPCFVSEQSNYSKR